MWCVNPMFVYWKRNLLIQFGLKKRKEKKTAYLNVIVLAIVEPNPVSLALPAFLVLLGEGRHPVIIYTES